MKKVWVIKIFPGYEIYPDDTLQEMPPYKVNLYEYKGTIGEANWAIANSMGCYANCYECTKEEIDAKVAYLNKHMYDGNFESYLEENFV